MTRSFKTEGIIIKRKNVGEHDRLITILTKKYGKMQIKANGVRKITSKRSPHVEQLNLSTISFYKGKGIPILTEAEVKQSFSKIKKDLKKIGHAYYACELIDCLCPDSQENEKVFSLLEKVLNDIAETEEILALMRDFELSLLDTLGYYSISAGSKDLEDPSIVIEQIIEKKLKTKQILPHLN